MKKSILLTGSNGLLGQKLVQLILKENNYKLIATARGDNRLPFQGEYTYQSLDITNEEEVYKVVEASKPDYIIHTAAMTNVDQCEQDRVNCWKQNVDAVKYLAQISEKLNIHLTHLSTDFIFDGNDGPYKEDAIANPLSYYGESKLAAEEIILNTKIRSAIARTVLVYGIAHDMSRTNIILWVKKSLEEGKKIQVVDDQWRSPTLAEDLAQGCYKIVQKDALGIFNISGKDLLTPYQMAIKTADYFNLNKDLIQKSDSTLFTQPAKRPLKTGFIIDKAVNNLGYAPHSFEEGISIVSEQIKGK